MFKRSYYTIVAILSLVFALEASAQDEFSIGASGGYATFEMNGFANFLRVLGSANDVDGKVTESFPAYYSYNVNVSRTIGKSFLVSALAGHTSTGGRWYYSDYTGYMLDDMLVNLTYTGIQGSYLMKQAGGIDFFAGAQALVYFNQVQLTETVFVNDKLSTDGIRLASFNGSFAPLLTARKQFGRFGLTVQAAYEFHVRGKVRYVENRDYYMVGLDGNPIKVEADGLRLNAGVYFVITRAKS